VPEELQNDPELWSGCISGALTEEGFLAAFENASFYGIQILKRDRDPWRTVQGNCQVAVGSGRQRYKRIRPKKYIFKDAIIAPNPR
jgi:hypothetical protein